MPSILCRLAGRNGVSVREFCRDLGLRYTQLINLEPPEVRMLADLSGIPCDALLRWTILPKTTMFAGHVLTPTAKNRGVLYACPECLREEIETNDGPFAQRAAIQGDWQLTAMSVCQRHHMPLSPLWSQPYAAHRFDIDTRMQEVYREVLSGSLDQPRRDPGTFERWFQSRLIGSAVPGWLASFPLFEAADLCLWLGQAVARYEQGPDIQLLYADALQLGFDLASSGEAAVTRALSDIQLASPTPTRNTGAVLGPLYTSFRTEQDIAARPVLANFMWHYIIAHWPFGPGDRLFGRSVQYRALYSLGSAAKLLGLGVTTTQKFLDKHRPKPGSLNDRRKKVAIYTAEHVEAAKFDFAGFVSSEILQERLGLQPNEFASLWEDGLLSPDGRGRGCQPLWCLASVNARFESIFLQPPRYPNVLRDGLASPRYVSGFPFGRRLC